MRRLGEEAPASVLRLGDFYEKMSRTRVEVGKQNAY
jgi:hypothetical protein